MFEKEIWELFKMDMSDINKANPKIEAVLRKVYERGKEVGKQGQIICTESFLKACKKSTPN